MNDIAQKAEALAEPFDPTEVKWKPQAVKGDRCMAIAYIDARLVMDRLDEVVGVDAWHDEYQVLDDKSVLCKLSLRFGDVWITKCDVGGQSEQPDEGDRDKAAFSDALKRAAVKWGIGRYLYRLPHQWVDYDAQKRQLKAKPSLPAWALPPMKSAAAVPPVSTPTPLPPPKQPTTQGTPGLNEEQQHRLKEAIVARGLEPELAKQLGKWLAAEYHVERLGLLDPVHLNDAVAKVKAWVPMATEKDREELDQLAGQLGWDAERLHDEFRRVGCPTPKNLTHVQARKVVKELESLVGVEVPA